MMYTKLIPIFVMGWIALIGVLIFSACSTGGDQVTREYENELELARSAAKAFCSEFDFPTNKIQELENPPLMDPVRLEREGHFVTSYRWLGGGRGDYYVQVEIGEDDSKVVVYGGYAHNEYGPWSYDASK